MKNETRVPTPMDWPTFVELSEQLFLNLTPFYDDFYSSDDLTEGKSIIPFCLSFRHKHNFIRIEFLKQVLEVFWPYGLTPYLDDSNGPSRIKFFYSPLTT